MELRLKLAFYAFIFLSTLNLYGQNSLLPIDAVKKEYIKLIGTGENSNIDIPKESITKLTDKIFIQFLPNVDFYSIIIQNFSHYEYNLGQIKAILAISKLNTNDLKLLLPLDYSKSSDNFLDLFYKNEINVSIDSLSHSIVRLFLNTYTIHTLITDNKMDSLVFNSTVLDHSIEVKVRWLEKMPTYKHGETIVANIPIQNTFVFFLENRRIQKITYKHWK